MGWSGKEPDPLVQEIKRLEREKRTLERQAKILEEEMANPVIQEEREINRGARILHESLSDRVARLPGRNRRRIRAQERLARNRVIAALVVLGILVIVLLRVL
jgi:hypothetical protein